MRATWQGTVLAESDETVVVDGNHYFPREAVRSEHVAPSEHTSRCAWKGTASYLDLVVGDERNENAAWYYPDTKPRAEHIRGHVAFGNGVCVAA